MTDGHFEIVNWGEYQHYGQRTPPWIKLHNQILDSFDLMQLDPSVRWLAIGMMLLASRTENRIPNDPRFIMNRLWMDDLSGLSELQRIGFLKCVECGASNVLASRASGALATGDSNALASRASGALATGDSNALGHGASTSREEERRVRGEREENTTTARERESADPKGMDRLRELLAGSASALEGAGVEIRGSRTWPMAVVGMYGPQGTKRHVLKGLDEDEVGAVLAESIVALAGEQSGEWRQPFFDSIVSRVARQKREGAGAVEGWDDSHETFSGPGFHAEA